MFRIVCDSSCNVLSHSDPNFATVPLKILAQREYVDDATLDVAQMVEDLRHHKGKSGSSCPNMGEWLDAFADGQEIFAITITKHLSGSYNAARQAAELYMEEHPGSRVSVIDSLSTGPEMMMIADKIRQCESEGMAYEETLAKVLDYANHNHTLFCLQSMLNLARNGRISMATAKLAGVLGIHATGDAEGGQLVNLERPRGPKKVTETLVRLIRERGFRDGNLLRVAHCFAEKAALALRDAMLTEFPHMRFLLEPTAGLCSFYAEEGGLIIGFEGCLNEKNDNRIF